MNIVSTLMNRLFLYVKEQIQPLFRIFFDQIPNLPEDKASKVS
jgi:hypothetical protein